MKNFWENYKKNLQLLATLPKNIGRSYWSISFADKLYCHRGEHYLESLCDQSEIFFRGRIFPFRNYRKPRRSKLDDMDIPEIYSVQTERCFFERFFFKLNTEQSQTL